MATVSFPFGTTITVHRTVQDRYGNVTDTADHAVAGCALAPSSGSSGQSASTEDTDRRDTVIRGLVLYGPPGADIQATDVIELPDGTRWQVDGDTGSWTSPFSGWRAGVQVSLSRVTG
jgi:hypothetical protein